MSWKRWTGAGTWLGAAAAAAILLLGLGISSLALLRGLLPESAMRPLVWGCSGAACFCGGRVAVRRGGDGALPRSLAVSACVYGAMWLAALTGDGPVVFDMNAAAQTCAVWGGGVLSGLMGSGRKRSRRTGAKRRRGETGRKRAVT